MQAWTWTEFSFFRGKNYYDFWNSEMFRILIKFNFKLLNGRANKKIKQFYFNYLHWTNHYFLKLEIEKAIKSSEEETIHNKHISITKPRALDNRHSLFCFILFCFVFFDKISQMQKWTWFLWHGLFWVRFVVHCNDIAVFCAHAYSHRFNCFRHLMWTSVHLCAKENIRFLGGFHCFHVFNFHLWKQFFMHTACCLLRMAFFLHVDYRFLRFLFPIFNMHVSKYGFCIAIVDEW